MYPRYTDSHTTIGLYKAPPVTLEPHALVVDDEILVALTLQGFLEACGFRVSIATNGAQALRHDELDPADLLLTDIRMPLMDGPELIRRIRERQPTLPVIVVSAETELVAGIEGIRRLPKPVTWSALRQAIKAVMPETAAEPAGY